MQKNKVNVSTFLKYLLSVLVLLVFFVSLFDLFDQSRNEPNVFGDLICRLVAISAMIVFSIHSIDSKKLLIPTIAIWLVYASSVILQYVDWQFQESGDFGNLYGTFAAVGLILSIILAFVYAILDGALSRKVSVVLLLAPPMTVAAFVFQPIRNFQTGDWIFILFYLVYYFMKTNDSQRGMVIVRT